MKKIFLGLLSLMMLGQMALALPVSAQTTPPGQDALKNLQQTGLGGSTSASDAGKQLPVLVGGLIRTLMGLLGIIFVVLMVYAGFLWMTARGDKGTVDKAKDIIRNSIIGIILIFLAYAITGFVVNAIVTATTK